MKKLAYFFFATLMVLAGCSGGNDDSEILDKDPQEEVENKNDKEEEPKEEPEDEKEDEKEEEPEVKNNIIYYTDSYHKEVYPVKTGISIVGASIVSNT